jgi:hypothetical protein
MYVWEDAWIPWIKFYLEVRPSCLLYLLLTILEYFSYRLWKVLEDLQLLGLRKEEVPAFMKSFFESGEKIHLEGVDVEDLELTIGFLEEMCTKDEIKRCVLSQYLKDLQEPGKNCLPRYGVLNDEHLDHISDWASRLGFWKIANGIKAIGLQYDIELPESESVSSKCEDM